MKPLEFVVPKQFSDATVYKRIGAIIFEKVSGKIVGHVQELGGWRLIESLPLPSGNPLGLAMKAVQSAQLHKIQETVNIIQTMATIGAVASVASLGVSIAGFAMVLSRLDRMEGQLDALLDRTEAVHQAVRRLDVKGDLRTRAQLQAALEEQVIARTTTDEDRRRQLLSSSIQKLAGLRHFYAGLLASQEFSAAVRTDSLVAVTDAQERFVTACFGELMGEFMLNDDPKVLAVRRAQQRALFDSICWKDGQDLHDLVVRGDREAKIDLVTDAKLRVERVQAVVSIREESTARLDSIGELASFLRERKVSSMDYLHEVEKKSAESDEPLIILDARG